MAKIVELIPTILTAPWLKQFFKRHLGIPVRVENAAGEKGYVRVWIQHYRCVETRNLIYKHAFTPEFGNRCMRVVYSTSEKLSSQNWGGNIGANGIAMHGHELRELLQGILDKPLEEVIHA